MKKCPYCAEEIQDAAVVCRYCGRDLPPHTIPKVVTKAESVEQNEGLERPLNGCLYTLIGFLFVNFLPLAVFLPLYAFPEINIELLAILSLLFLCIVLYFATVGRYGKLSFLGVLNIILWSYIPVANWWVAYYLGRGLHMKLSRQELRSPPNASPIGIIILAIIFVVAWLGSASNTQSSSISISPTTISRTNISPTRTPMPRPTFTQNPCFKWDEVSPAMDGKEICVYGMVSEYTENWENQLTNMYFGSRSEFFLVSNYRWSNEVEGTCVSANGEVQLNTYGTPYIKVDEIYDCGAQTK